MLKLIKDTYNHLSNPDKWSNDFAVVMFIITALLFDYLIIEALIG